MERIRVSAQRLLEIAQRLDELSEDGASELQALSTELGTIADNWPDEKPPAEIPNWAREMRGVMFRALMEDPDLMRRVQDESFFRRQAQAYSYRDRLDAVAMQMKVFSGGV
jgi:hypothetical protein